MNGFIAVLGLNSPAIEGVTTRAVQEYLKRRSPTGEIELCHSGRALIGRWGPGAALNSSSNWFNNSGEPEAAVSLALAGEIYGPAPFGNNGDKSAAELGRCYTRRGLDCLNGINGRFSLVIWDERSGTLHGATDRIGLGSLYYYRDERQFICATDIRAILALPGVRRAADPLAIADYFFCGNALGGRTHFAGIHDLIPGHTFSLQGDTLTTAPYWDLEFDYDQSRTDAEVVEELTGLLEDAVRLRIQAPISTGGHLSGGLDSSVVMGLAARQGHRLSAFSIRFNEGAAYDESSYAQLVADHFDIELNVATPSAAELIRYWPALISEHGAPLANSGAFSYHAATRLAATQVDQILAGHGGDEIFGGYPAQFMVGFGGARWFDPLPGHLAEAPSPGTRLRRLLSRRGISGLINHLLARTRPAPKTAVDKWVQLHCSQTVAENRIISRDFVRALGNYSPKDDYLTNFCNAVTDELFDRCLYHDLRSYLPVLLRQSESVARGVGVEVRCPLLDHRVVEFAARIRPEQKVRGEEPKYLLRRMAHWLPEEVRGRRDKRGFPVPISSWLTGELAPWSERILNGPEALDRGILDPDQVRRGALAPGLVWSAINVELWFRIFIDQDPEWCEQARAIEYERAQRLSSTGAAPNGGSLGNRPEVRT